MNRATPGEIAENNWPLVLGWLGYKNVSMMRKSAVDGHTVIPIHWDDATSTLTLGARQGSYPGMPAAMEFDVVLVRNGHGIGEAVTGLPDQVIHYDGQKISTKVQP